MTDTGFVAVHPYIDGGNQFVPEGFVDELEGIADEHAIYCVEQRNRTGVRPRDELAGEEFYDGFFPDVEGRGKLVSQAVSEILEHDPVYVIGGKGSFCVPYAVRSIGRYREDVFVDPDLTYEPIEGEFLSVSEAQEDEDLQDTAVFRPLYFSGATVEPFEEYATSSVPEAFRALD